ncbi:hypothetical protein [Planococcus beigongshangi]|uniref:hypothetical protein n=1 Tax=Planococcus beigongshangi TaxID=2782536 RepID=UPI00193B2703|nr:hypothetical protein [Planococcus beigongshangi]
MINVLFGLLFVFFKPNFEFLDIGIVYYLTNIIGYLLLFLGVRELGRQYEKVLKAQPYVIFMVVHSIFFFLLNISGKSPLTIPMDSRLAIVSLVGLGFAIAGMFMVFVIISFLIEGLQIEFPARRLSMVVVLMMMTFAFAGLCYFFIPGIAPILMSVLLALNVIFLFGFYNVFIRNNERVMV